MGVQRKIADLGCRVIRDYRVPRAASAAELTMVAISLHRYIPHIGDCRKIRLNGELKGSPTLVSSVNSTRCAYDNHLHFKVHTLHTR